jgi:hypothetical protein
VTHQKKYDVALDERASEAEMDAISEIWAGTGLLANVSASYGRKAFMADTTSPWIIMITTPVGVGLTAFLRAFGKSFGEALGKSASQGICDGIRRLAEARACHSDRGNITIDDSTSHRQFILKPTSPNEAIEALLDGRYPPGCDDLLVWDTDDGRWVSSG